jgi:glycogen debranching enzyme
MDFSTSLAEKGLPTTITCEADIETLVAAFQDFIKGLELWQYYVMDASHQRAAVKNAIVSGKYRPWAGPDVKGKNFVELSKIIHSLGKIQKLGSLASRFCVTVNPDIAAAMIKAAFVDLTDPDGLADGWVKVVDVINVPLYQQWKEDTRIALQNIKNRAKYIRLNEHGPMLGEITKTYACFLF